MPETAIMIAPLFSGQAPQKAELTWIRKGARMKDWNVELEKDVKNI
jgi:hypothetical protein